MLCCHSGNIGWRFIILDSIMDFLNSIFNFFSNAKNSISRKAFWAIFIVFAIFFLDNSLSFSFYINNQYKLDQIEKINEIIRDSSFTREDELFLFNLREEIIYRETWKESTENFLSDFEFEKNENLSTVETSEKPEKNRDYFWHFISSSWLFLLLIIIFPFALFKSTKTNFLNTLLGLLVFEGILYLFAWLAAKLLSYLPIMFNDPIYNYIFNAIVPYIILVTSYYISKPVKTNKTNPSVRDL